MDNTLPNSYANSLLQVMIELLLIIADDFNFNFLHIGALLSP